MTGNIIGEPFDPFVQLQIGVRQSTQSGGYNTLRTPEQLQYLTNRNAWVKLASSVSIQEGETIIQNTQTNSSGQTVVSNSNSLNGLNVNTGGTIGAINTLINTQVLTLKSEKLRRIGIENPENFPGSKLAESAILFNTLSSFTPSTKSYSDPRSGVSNNANLWNNNYAYGLGGSNYGLQSPPGIIGIQVDSLNRGSIRKASITLKAHNRFQFDIIELLYLRLGFTMILEWGWDKYLDNNGTVQQVGNTIIEEEWFTSNGITQLQMLAKIQNTRKKYAGNYDGFFGKVSNFTWTFNPDGSYDISIDLITIGDIIESLKVNTSVKEKFYPDRSFEEIKFNEGSKLYNTNIAKASTLNTIGYFLYKKIEELTNNFSYKPNENSSENYYDYITFFNKNNTSYKSPQYYIRLGEFFSQLESLIIPKIQNNGNTSTLQISFEKIGCLISYFPNQIPLDPRVCIFKPSLNSYGDITGINNPSYFNSIPATYIETINGNLYGMLMNLYINFEFISGLLVTNGGPDQELSLFKFLQDLCNGINNALGGVNKLEPVIKDDYKITIIDQTLLVPQENNTVNLEVYGYNPDNQTSNFVKDIKFISKITPQLASMISIGATAAGSSVSEIDGTAFSKWSEGLVDRFSREIIEPNGFNQLALTQQEQQEADRQAKYKEKFSDFTFADRSLKALAGEAIENILSGINYLDYIGSEIAGFLNIFEKDYAAEASKKALQRAYNVDKDDEEKRIVREPLYPEIDGLEMYFAEYYARITQLEKDDVKKGVFKKDEINELVSTNYSIYLLKAFGGVSNEVKVKFLGTTKNSVITGYGSSPYFTDRTATTETLQVKNNDTRYLEFDDVFISQGKSAYRVYLNNLNNVRYQTENIPSNEVGFIPLSFDLTLDGISGIKIYNKLNINNNFLPSNYPESLDFIITKVNHTLSNNSWDTTLSTISIPKTQPYKFNTPIQASNIVPNNIESNNTISNNSSRVDPKSLKTSLQGKEFIKKEEGFRAEPYEDGGSLSIGYGFKSRALGREITKDTRITKEEADTVFDARVIPIYEKIVQNTITSPLTQFEFDSLVSIAYNAGEIGNRSAGNPTPLRDTLNSENYLEAANIIPKYRTTSEGKVLSVLEKRRAKEQKIFISGNYIS